MVDSLRNLFTAGDFETEAGAWEFFDGVIEKTKAFKVYTEVPGQFVSSRPKSEIKGARIDRILIPLRRAIDSGWQHGAIGIEGKKSGTKIGKVISQAMDYSRCVFEIDNGFLMMLQWVFIWPVEATTGDVASLMAQQRIGWIKSSKSRPLVFGCGGTNGLEIDSNFCVTAKRLPMGNKAGNRG